MQVGYTSYKTYPLSGGWKYGIIIAQRCIWGFTGDTNNVIDP